MSNPAGLTDEEQRVWRAYRSAHGQLVRELDRRLQADANISQADFAVLVALLEADRRRERVGRLAELLAWEKSRVSHQVTRMESRGLIVRTECDLDARGTWIELTPSGRRTVLGALRGHAKAVRELFLDVLTADERDATLTGSERVLEHLDPALCASLPGERDVDPDDADDAREPSAIPA